MPTSLMATSGEMDAIAQPADTSHEALREALRSAAYAKLGNNNSDGYISVNSVYDDFFIAYRSDYSNRGNEETYYKIGYAKGPDNTIVLGEPVEVKRKEVWEPVTSGEMEDKTKMKKELKDLVDAGKINVEDLKLACGEMGIKLTNEQSKLEKVCGEMFGKTGDELITTITELAKQAKAKSQNDVIDKLISEKVSGEMAQGIVKKMLHVPENADEKIIAGEIDSILADDFVKSVLAKSHTDIKPPVGEMNNNNVSDMFVMSKVSI